MVTGTSLYIWTLVGIQRPLSRMLKLVALVVLVAAATAAPYTFDPEMDVHWTNFKLTFAKTYAAQEEMYRRMIFEKNVEFITNHNMQADLGHKTFRVGINEFADLTSLEFARQLTGYVMRNETTGSTFLAASNSHLPKKMDWRTKGYVTKVKNQEQCGSCWAFSATGSLEGQHFKKSGKLVSLSEQNLVDCSDAEGNQGCNGGLMDQAFDYIKKQGIDTESSYPYEAQDGQCRFKKQDVGATCTGYVDIPTGKEKALEKAVATIGPISVAIDASHQSFQLYKDGLYYEPQCSATQLDHGVLAVGYGQADGGAYWLVKNSWGASWGMKGYIHMSRNHDNNCGIATQASYPLV